MKRIILMVLIGCISTVDGKVHPYASLRGGVSLAKKANVKATLYGTPPQTGESEFDIDPGANIEGALGMGISGGIPIRLELAGGYQQNELNTLGGEPIDGKFSTGTVMANLYFDLVEFDAPYEYNPYNDPLVPYFFLGAGAAFVEGELEGETEDDTVAAANAGFGVAWILSEQLWMDLQYKYLVAKDLVIEDSTGKAEIELVTHQLQVGVRYMF